MLLKSLITSQELINHINMFKLFVFLALVAVAFAAPGYLAAPGVVSPLGYAAAPVAYSAYPAVGYPAYSAVASPLAYHGYPAVRTAYLG